METTGLLIDAVDLRNSFNDNEEVCGVSFHVYHGEIFGILGKNGSVKTTTILLITGQIFPTVGEPLSPTDMTSRIVTG